MKKTQQNKGFTLVEMSIVIVIVGFLAAGVLVGKDLIRTSQVASVISDIERYSVAIGTFRQKYNSLPGDMSDANDFWAAAVSGDDNGVILWNTEGVAAWEHLALAGFIPGSYTGVLNGGADMVINENVPRSKITNGAYMIRTQDTYTVTGANIQLGTLYDNGPNIIATGAILNSQESWSIDNKIDDGLADDGRVATADGNGTLPSRTCTTGIWTENTSDYNLDEERVSCTIFFYIKELEAI